MSREHALQHLRKTLNSYTAISDDSWAALKKIITFRQLPKHSVLYAMGTVPASFTYVYQGLVRGYVCDEKGNEYNKNFFEEGRFPGSMVALLTSTPSLLAFETIEDSLIFDIDFAAYRQLMLEKHDLKLFQIYYLEKNWLLSKDARETQLVQDNATTRYQRLMTESPGLVERLTQYHIASHLGITPTQLSRIRKNLLAD